MAKKNAAAAATPAEGGEPPMVEIQVPAIESRASDSRQIHLNLLHESLTNPRKDFGDLVGLATSVKRHGVLQPILVRPFANGGGEEQHFEVVAGHRRLRAAREAGLAEIPATVRELTDAEAAELQLVENAKRKDVNPLEESEACRRLHSEHELSAEEIALRVGKSKASVYAAMKLGDLVDPGAVAAVKSGALSGSVGLLVSRLPAKDQAKATKMVLEGDDGEFEKKDEPLSYREAQKLLMHRFYLRPAEAPFDASDASLVPAAGPCTKCPKRVDISGVTVVGQKVGKEDLCDDRDCWSKKEEAALAKALKKEKELGIRTVSSAEVFQGEDEDFYEREDGKFAFLDEHPDYDDVGFYSRQSWEEVANAVVKADGSGPEGLKKFIVATVDPRNDNKPLRLVDKAVLIKAAKAAKVLQKPAGGSHSSSSGSRPEKKATPQTKVVEKINEALTASLVSAISSKVRGDTTSEPKLFRLLVAEKLNWRTPETCKKYGVGSGSWYSESAGKVFAKLEKLNAAELRVAGVEAVLEKRLEETPKDDRIINLRGSRGIPEPYLELGKIFGVDVAELEKQARLKMDVELNLLKKAKPTVPVKVVVKPGKASKKPPLRSSFTPKPSNAFQKIAAAGRKAAAEILKKKAAKKGAPKK